MATRSRASSSPSAGHSEMRRVPVVRSGALLIAAVCGVLALSACDNVLNDDEKSFHMRFVNLLEDSPTVQYKLDDTVLNSAGYLATTTLSPARPGTHTVSFAAVRPTSLDDDDGDEGDPIPLGGSFERDYARDRDYTVIAFGTLDDVRTFVVEEPSDRGSLDDDYIEWHVLNAAPNAPSVEVYITAPEAQITTPQKMATLALGEKSEPAKLKLFRRPDVTDEDAALIVDLTFELRDAATGVTLFHSPKVRLQEAQRVLFAIARNIGPGPSTLKMFGVDGYSGTLYDTADQAAVRIVHVSADTPPLDIIRGSSLGTPIAQNLAFRDASAYVIVPHGEVDLIGVPAGGTSVFLFLEEFNASRNGSYSAYTVGPLASVDAVVLTDDRRSVPTQSKFRFLHAAHSQEEEDGLDVYVTLPGQVLDFDSTDDDDTSDNASRFRRGTIDYRSATDYIILKSGRYQVRFAATGTSRIVLDTEIIVQDGSVQTFVLTESEARELELIPVEEAL
jgi:hypothetical protein